MADQERSTGIIVAHPNRTLDPDYSKDFSVIGKTGLPRKDGYVKVSGKAIFSSDFAFPGSLYGRALSCPYAHATIKSMNTSKAEMLPGVRYILKYDDPDPIAQFVAASATGTYEGKPMGAIVVADTEEIAEEGVRLLEVEWEVLPFVLECDDALAPGAPSLNPANPKSNLITGPETGQAGVIGQIQGDVQQGFAEADQIIEFTTYRPEDVARVEQATCSVYWKKDHYDYVLGGQINPSLLLMEQKPMGLSQAAGFMHPTYHGGGFGCGNATSYYLFLATACLSQRLERPVKMIYGFQQSYYFAMANDCGYDTFKVGFKNDGTITAVQEDSKYNSHMQQTGIGHIEENTSVKNLLCNFSGAYTNRPQYNAYRSEQRVGAAGLTLVTNHVAAELGMDPAEVALKNDGAHGENSDYLMQFKKDNGFPSRDSLKECISVAKKAIDFDNVWHAPGEKTLTDGRKHGIGFAWNHGWADAMYQAMCVVVMRIDGTAQIVANHNDIGVNSASVYCQIAAEELGLKYEDVFFKPNCESYGLELMSPASAANTSINGWAIKKACQKVKAQILETATKGIIQDLNPTYEVPILPEKRSPLFPNLNPEDLDIKDGVIFEKKNSRNAHTVYDLMDQTQTRLTANPFYQAPFLGYGYYNAGVFGIDMPHRERLTRQAHYAEVAVDTDTGEVEVLRIVAVNDVGKALDPVGVAAQQYGGTYMGLGRCLLEEGIYDPSTGVRLNGNILDYKVPTMRDCGPIDTHFIETALGYGPYGACGVGESCSDMMSHILAPAVHNAIGVWIQDFPITPNKVLKALGKA